MVENGPDTPCCAKGGLYQYGPAFDYVPHVPAKCTHNKVISLMSRHATAPLALPVQATLDRFKAYVQTDIENNDLFRPLEDNHHRHDPKYLENYINSRPYELGKKLKYL